MPFQVIIWDKDNSDLFIYLFEDRDITLGSVLKSYTIFGNKSTMKIDTFTSIMMVLLEHH